METPKSEESFEERLLRYAQQLAQLSEDMEFVPMYLRGMDVTDNWILCGVDVAQYIEEEIAKCVPLNSLNLVIRN